MKYAKDPLVDRSLRHSVKDGMCHAAMAGSAETYLSAFALFLKANAAQVALLATLPPLLGALAQLLSAWLARWLPARKPVVLVGAALQGFAWIPILGLPLLFPAHAVTLLLAGVTVYYFAGQLTSPLWTSWMGDLVPEKRRGRFFGCRTRLTTISSFVALVAAGLVLQEFARRGLTAWGFGALFVFAVLARARSVVHLWRMHEPSLPPAQREMPLDRDWLLAARERGALRFSLFYGLMQGAVAIASPLFAVYMLRDLRFSYVEFTAAIGTMVLVQFLTLGTWGRLSDVYGHRQVLAVTAAIVPLMPVLWLVSDNFWYILVIQGLSGAGWAGFSLAAGNLFYDVVPPRQRVTYSAAHNVAVAAAVFVGGLIGAGLLPYLPKTTAWLGDRALATPLVAIFAVSTLVRLAVVAVFLPRVRQVGRPRKQTSPQALLARLAHMQWLAGPRARWPGAPAPLPGMDKLPEKPA